MTAPAAQDPSLTPAACAIHGAAGARPVQGRRGAFGRSLEQKPRGLHTAWCWGRLFPVFSLPVRSGDGLTSRTTTHSKVNFRFAVVLRSDSHKAVIARTRPLWLAAKLVADGATYAANSRPCSMAARSPSMARAVCRTRKGQAAALGAKAQEPRSYRLSR